VAFLSIKALSAGYGPSVIIRGIDLDVEEGDSLAIVGKNGAGKSTLVNSIFGGTTIISGSIRVEQTELVGQPGHIVARRGVSIVPQGRMILSNLSVKENLLLGAASARPGHWSLARVVSLFPILGERLSKPGTALSGGEQQMLAIGRALLGNPRILLLDEPSEGLSPVVVDQLVSIFDAIRRAGSGIVVVEQHLSLVRRATQRFVVIAKGAIIDCGRSAEIDSEKHKSSIAF
jgi:branched-chain amino acid transport system ATP-binding protein